MEKYYTPEIEEFHVGFEFESNYVLFSNSLEWKKIIFGEGRLTDDLPWFYSAYEGDAIPTEFRVKRLDREDIESLGFKIDKPYGSVIGFKYSDEEGVFLSSKKVSIWHEFKSKHTSIARVKDWEDGMFTKRKLFQGTIKNKSELKRLLKQLGIWN